MLIRCPTCASGYELPPHLLSEGRILRCAHCRDAWVHRVSDERSSARPPIAVEARSARQALPASPRRSRRPGGRTGSPRIAAAVAAALLLATVAGGMAGVGQRARIVAAFRPSAALFSTLGLPVNLRGLKLADIRSTLGTIDGRPTLTLDGTITNLRSETTPVPAIRVAVRDASGRDLYFWTTPAPKARLAIGETMPFHARLSAPPRDGETVSVSFADPPAPGPRHLAQASLTER